MKLISNESLVNKCSLELSKQFNALGQQQIGEMQRWQGVQNTEAMCIAVMAHAQSLLHILNFQPLKADARAALANMVTEILSRRTVQ